jgi:hypothetical protein
VRVAVFLVLGLVLAFLVFGLVVGAVAYLLMPKRGHGARRFKSPAIGEVGSVSWLRLAIRSSASPSD